jgi:hypothetical protein
MTNPIFTAEFVDERLFGSGLTVADYFLSRTPFSEVILYTEKNGGEFYLSVSNDELAQLLKMRLIELGVRVEEKDIG